ncbi:MAG TPA: chromate efflux transporter [Cyclobacteriaceae bacterium]
MNQPVKPSFKEAFQFWLKLGFISFGGPAGQIAIMHEFLVEKKKWISDSRFLHALNYCMLLPGPEAQQLATYVGWLLHGVRGGIVAGFLFIFPAILILLVLSITYVLFGKVAWVASLFYGLKPAVVAIVILALIKIGKKSLLSPFHYAVAIISFIGIFFFNISFPLIILFTILLGLACQKIFPSFFKQNSQAIKADEEETSYYLNRFSPPVSANYSWKTTALKIVSGILLWFIPLSLLFIWRSDFSFWSTLTLFFTKAAFVTFGGAYAVLPYVAQESVEKFQWLSQYQMIDGMALGETTPGPLIMILVFVGFMAGYNHSGSLWDGTWGLLTTTYYTFLPSFIFILGGAPLVERTQENEKLKSILSIVTAAVVGVVLNLTLYFGKAVLFPNGIRTAPDPFSVMWLMISFVALFRFKINMVAWIGISALAGLLYQLF